MLSTKQLKNRIVKIFTCNWQPKLICLGLALLVWGVVEIFYVKSFWNLDDTTFSIISQ